jgi:hypothetical protein
MPFPTVSFDPTKTVVPQKSYALFTESPSIAVSGANVTDIFTATAHGMANGQAVILTVTTGLTGATSGNTYYVINANANDFQLSTTVGGAALNFTADGTGFVGKITSLIGKVANYDQTIETVKREVPGADNLLRADRIVAIRQSESFKFELEEVNRLSDLFGGLSGIKQGTVQLWIVDPDDAASKVAIKTNAFACTATLQGGINFTANEFSKATIMFDAREKITFSIDATA